MIHPTIGTALADERQAEIAEGVRHMPPAASRSVPEPESLTLRLADPEDLDSVRRLVELDGSGGGTRHMLLDLTRPGAPRRVLLATAGGEPLAALHLDTGHHAADPLRHSATAIELLRTRAAQLAGTAAQDRGGLGALLGRLRLRPN